MIFPRRILALFTILGLFGPGVAYAFDPNYLISDAEFTDEDGMGLSEIKEFLKQGYLGSYKTDDWEGRRRTAADIVYRAAQDHGINPRVLLVMLQKEQSLVEDEDPTEKQLDWAMGYGVCDSCGMNDSAIQRWKGFGKQVNSASMQLSDGYLADIERTGKTSGLYGPGVPVTINNTRVVPHNAATAALYAYTPHLHGNQLFVTLWDKWFGQEYPSGTLVQIPGEDGVWLIDGDEKRAITSESALTSRFNKNLIVPISAAVLARYSEGSPISLPNYSIVRDELGDIYLVVDDALRHIEDMATFRSIGFSEDEIVDITDRERAAYDEGEPISGTTVFPQGRLLQLNTNGAVFFVKDGVRQSILDASIMRVRFGARPSITPVTPVEVEQYREGKPLTLPDGTLIKMTTSPEVYVIEYGKRRLIPSESVFLSFGYGWGNIVDVPESVLKLHPLGSELEGPSEN